MDGADGNKNRVVLVDGERPSADDREEFERTEKRGCGCTYAMKGAIGVLSIDAMTGTIPRYWTGVYSCLGRFALANACTVICVQA